MEQSELRLRRSEGIEMNELQALKKMVAPSMRRRAAWLGGIVQIHITRACDKACFGCTQGSNLSGKTGFIPVEKFEEAVVSLKDYFGVVGIFGGNPALHPKFDELCQILGEHIRFSRRYYQCAGKGGRRNPIYRRGAFLVLIFLFQDN